MIKTSAPIALIVYLILCGLITTASGQYFCAVIFKDDGTKFVTRSCYMTQQEAEMGLMLDDHTSVNYFNKLIKYRFAEFEDCTSFIRKVKTMSSEFSAAVASGSDRLLASGTPLTEVVCECKDMMKKLFSVMTEVADNEDTLCKSILEDVTKVNKIGDICPQKAAGGLLGDLFAKAVCFVTDQVTAVIDKAVLDPICDNVNSFLIERGVSPIILNTSPADVVDEVAGLTCGILMCDKPDERFCIPPSALTFTGKYSKALVLTGVCSSSPPSPSSSSSPNSTVPEKFLSGVGSSTPTSSWVGDGWNISSAGTDQKCCYPTTPISFSFNETEKTVLANWSYPTNNVCKSRNLTGNFMESATPVAVGENSKLTLKNGDIVLTMNKNGTIEYWSSASYSNLNKTSGKDCEVILKNSALTSTISLISMVVLVATLMLI